MRLISSLFLFAAACATASAQNDYPAKSIRWIVAVPPGGSADNLARTLQPRLSEALGQTIVIDNRPGGSSTIGTEMVAHAAPDGYTILLITTTHTVNPSLISKLPFDPVKDFAPISLVVSQSNFLVVHPQVPAKSVKELVALAKAKPGSLTFASGGNGSSPHLSGELFKIVAAIDITHVPYKGTGPGLTDLLGGHVQIMFAGPLTLEPFIKAGRLRPLAYADKKRSAILPEVPTMTEAGFAGVETGTWYGVLAPAGTPQPIISRLHAGFLQALAAPEVKSRLAGQGVEVVGNTPAEFGRYMRAEIGKWSKVVRDAHVRVD
jgi:tripartite-type tricarboxylate transporter receptor subunit TctC